MRLFIRTQEPGERRDHVQYDRCFEVSSQVEWKRHIEAVGKDILTSVLQSEGERFRLRGKHLYTRSHQHETHYVYDAAVTTRRYHPALSHDDALKVIVEGRGTHFDPAIVDAFLAVSTALRDSHDARAH